MSKLTTTDGEGKRECGRRVHVGKATSVLTGACFCGHCGHRMSFKGRGRRFCCASPSERPSLQCKQRTATEAYLWPIIRKELVEAVDYEALKLVEAKPEPAKKADVEGLRKQAAELEAKVERAWENILLASRENFPQLQAKLDQWTAELAKVRNTITLATSDATADERAARVKWLESVQLVKVLPTKLTFVAERKATPQERNVTVMGMSVKASTVLEYKVAKPLFGEVEGVRNLLHALHCKLYLPWTPNGKVRWRLDTGRLKVKIDRATNGTTEHSLRWRQTVSGWMAQPRQGVKHQSVFFGDE